MILGDPFLTGLVLIFVAGTLSLWLSYKLHPVLGWALVAGLSVYAVSLWSTGGTSADSAMSNSMGALVGRPPEPSSDAPTFWDGIGMMLIAIFVVGPAVISSLIGTIVGTGMRRPQDPSGPPDAGEATGETLGRPK